MVITFTAEELATLADWACRQRESSLDDVIPMTIYEQKQLNRWFLSQLDPESFGFSKISRNYVDPWITVDQILAGAL